MVAVFFVVFGALAITEAVRELWIGDGRRRPGRDRPVRRAVPDHRRAAQGRRRARRLHRPLLRDRDAHRLDLPRGVPRGGDRRAALGLRVREEYLRLRGETPRLRDSRDGADDRPSSRASSTSPATTAARPRCATCSRFHGVEISEELAFGLGAGPCFYYFADDDLSPSRFTNGRTGRLEESFLELTGAPLRLRTADDPERVLGARPRDRRRRPPGAADHRPLPPRPLRQLRALPRPRRRPRRLRRGVRLRLRHRLRGAAADLARGARAGPPRAAPLLPAGRAHGRHARRAPTVGELLAAAPRAIARAARRMLEPDLGEFEGLPALRRLAAEIGAWPADAPDWQWCARFNYQVIERRGTGGANFRPLYARFLPRSGGEPRPSSRNAAPPAGPRWQASFSPSVKEEQGDVASWSLVSQRPPPSSRPRSGSGTRSPDDRARKPGPGPGKVPRSLYAGLPRRVKRGDPRAAALLQQQPRLAAEALHRGRGLEVRVAEELADDQPAAGPEHPRDLAHRPLAVGDLAEHGGQDHRVHRAVVVGQGGRVGLGRDQVLEPRSPALRMTWSSISG